jgi:hypothetical protein
MSAILRAKNNESFMFDVKQAFGEGFIQRTEVFGFRIGPKEVNTSKLTNEIARQTIAHTAISPVQASNFYKRAFTICAACVAVAAIAYFSLGSISSALPTNNQNLLN